MNVQRYQVGDCVTRYQDSDTMSKWSSRRRPGREFLRGEIGGLLPLPSVLGVESYLFVSGLFVLPEQRGTGAVTRLIEQGVSDLGKTRNLLCGLSAGSPWEPLLLRNGFKVFGGSRFVRAFLRMAGPVS